VSTWSPRNAPWSCSSGPGSPTSSWSTAAEYVAAYAHVVGLADAGTLPPLGLQVVIGPSAVQEARNSRLNIADGRTHPIMLVGHRPT
jgi:hypothetical protein